MAPPPPHGGNSGLVIGEERLVVVESEALVAVAPSPSERKRPLPLVADEPAAAGAPPPLEAEAASADGRLLRMFVAREEHSRAGAREAATQRWLIREEFYDRWLDEFARVYAPRQVEPQHLPQPRPEDFALLPVSTGGQLTPADGAARRPGSQELVPAERAGPRPPGLVDELEARLAAGREDVFTLRDTLLAALAELSSPRRLRGRSRGKKMTEEAIAKLRLQEMTRLRDLVIYCLQGIWSSGVGGDMLLAAVQGVRAMMERYEAKEERGVHTAMQGQQWQRLRELVAEVDDDMPLALQVEDAVAAAPTRPQAPHGKSEKAGKGSRAILQIAIDALGGEATSPQITKWIREHQDELQSLPDMQLNAQSSKKARCAPGRPTWEDTMQSELHRCCEHSRKIGHLYVWRMKPLATAAAKHPPLPAGSASADEDDLPLGKLLGPEVDGGACA